MSTEGTVDTLTETGAAGLKGKIRRRSVKERREIVEETLVAGASVARVARRHDVNANQVFYWRKLYREGRLGDSAGLLAVKVSPDATVKPNLAMTSGTMEIKVGKGMVRVAGAVDVQALRAVLECLAR